MNSFLEYLKENPDCLYIYNRDFSIYGLPSKERYTIIVKDGFILPEEFDDEYINNYNKYEFFFLKEWFEQVLNGKLIGWECACLNKKYIIKEHVKLLMTTNPLQLRKDVDSFKKEMELFGEPADIKVYFELIKTIKFSIQIIENHKIVNYKDALNDYNLIKNSESLEERHQIINKSYEILRSLTNGAIKQEILKKTNVGEL